MNCDSSIRPVDVTHVIPTMNLATGGPPVVVQRICEHLPALGWTCRVVTTGAASDHETDFDGSADGDYETLVFSSRRGGNFAYSKSLSKSIDRIVASSRLVHIHTAWSYPGLAAMRACRRQRVPYVFMPHGMFDPNSLDRKRLKKQLYGQFVEWPAVRSAAAMIYTHEEERRLAESAVRGLPAGFVVPLGADEPPQKSRETLACEFFCRFPQLRGTKLVLFLSRLHPKKGLDLLIPAFRSVAAGNREAHLLIVGGGQDKYVSSLRRMIDDVGIADRATLAGPLHGEVKWEAIAAATMLVLPSYQENFALVVAEAMRLGLPIVLSRRVNIWTDVVESAAGLACDLDAVSIAAAIDRFLSDRSLAESAGCRGQRLVAEKFNWARTATELEAAYSSVLAKSKNPIAAL